MNRTVAIVFSLLVVLTSGVRVAGEVRAVASVTVPFLIAAAITVAIVVWVVIRMRRQIARVIDEQGASFGWWTTAPAKDPMANGVLAGTMGGKLSWMPARFSILAGSECRLWDVRSVQIQLKPARVLMCEVVLIEVFVAGSSEWRGYVRKPKPAQIEQSLSMIGCTIEKIRAAPK